MFKNGEEISGILCFETLWCDKIIAVQPGLERLMYEQWALETPVPADCFLHSLSSTPDVSWSLSAVLRKHVMLAVWDQDISWHT